MAGFQPTNYQRQFKKLVMNLSTTTIYMYVEFKQVCYIDLSEIVQFLKASMTIRKSPFEMYLLSFCYMYMYILQIFKVQIPIHIFVKDVG